MNSRVSFSLLLLVFFSTPAASAGEKPWTEIRSPHFRVLTNGSPTDARKVAHEFEQMRNVFANHLTNARLESGAPLLIFAVRDEETANALEPHIWKIGNNRAGEYHHGWEKQFAIVRLDTWGREGAKQVVYHEYTHSIEHMNSHWLPVWFDEGTAEIYGYTRFEAHRTYIGAPTERVKTLRDSTPILVETLIGLNHRSPYYLDPSKNQRFYAESWALVHMLTYGPGMENGKRLGEFLNLLQQGVEQKKAFQQEFGDFKKVDRDLESYMKQPTFAATVLKDPEHVIDEETFSARTLTVAETEAELGTFHLWTHDLTGARTELEQALKDDPKLALAHESMGFVAFAEGNDSLAGSEFSQAYALDGTRYLSLYAKTMVSSLPTSREVADLNAYGSALGKVLQLNPQFAPAYVQLARLAVRENDLQSALLISRKTEELEPSLAGYHLQTGQILQRLGKNEEAAADAKFVADRWVGPDHDEAAELWNKIPPDQRSPGETISAIAPEGTQTLEGLVKSVTCGGEDKWALVIDHDGHALTFHHKGGFATGFSDTLWYGGDHFSLCHHLEGLRAVVSYRPPADATYAGDIAEIGIRDDLPAPLKEPVAAAKQ